MAKDDTSAQDKAIEETAERLRQLNERIIDASKKSGRAYMEAYEANLKAIADHQAKLASASETDWLSALLNAQADFTRELARAASAQSRELLK